MLKRLDTVFRRYDDLADFRRNSKLSPQGFLKKNSATGRWQAVSGQRTQYAANSKAFKNESLMLTGDFNVIDVQWIFQYWIEDPILFLFNVRDTPKTIRDITE